MLTTPYPSNRYFLQLGKILVSKKPEIAKQLIEEYLPQKKPIETDLTKVPNYWVSFCKMQDIEPGDYIGALYKGSKIDERRIFVAAMVLLYNSGTRNLAKEISDTLGQHKSATCKMIPQVEMWYKVNVEFREKVDAIIKKITT